MALIHIEDPVANLKVVENTNIIPISMYEFLAFPTVKGNPCSISTVWGNSYLSKKIEKN